MHSTGHASGIPPHSPVSFALAKMLLPEGFEEEEEE